MPRYRPLRSLAELQAAAANLTEQERGILAASLFDSLRPPDDCLVSDDEVYRRSEELRSGKVQDISFEELKSGLDLPRES